MGIGLGRAHYVALGTVLAGVLLAVCPCVFALDPTLDLGQYAHTAWRIREGFAKGTVSDIAQTPDGYLWLGTEFGVLKTASPPRNWDPPTLLFLRHHAATSSRTIALVLVLLALPFIAP